MNITLSKCQNLKKSSMHEQYTNEIVGNNPDVNETSDEGSTSSKQEISLTPHHPQIEAHK